MSDSDHICHLMAVEKTAVFYSRYYII